MVTPLECTPWRMLLARRRMKTSLELPTPKSSALASSQRNAGDGGRWGRKEARAGACARSRTNQRTTATLTTPGSHGKREDGADREAGPVEQQCRQRADHRAHRVHGAVQAEGEPALVGRHSGGEEGIARRCAHALAEPIDEPAQQGDRPHEGERQDELAERRGAVAGAHEGPAPARVV